MELLARYDYPNIKENAITEFSKELKLWFIKMRDTSVPAEYDNWNYLILIPQSSRLKNIQF